MKKEVFKKQNPKPEPEYYADTMEQEKTVKTTGDFNLQKGIFTNKYSEGLNTDCGVFHRSAIFRTDLK